MNTKCRVDLKDKYRVLMTELLPYELPLWFSNDQLHRKLNEKEDFLNDILPNGEKLKNFVPLDYKIRRTDGSPRVLSIMHPMIQKDFCDFYDKYQDLFLYYCKRSKNSLRHPVKVVKSFFRKELAEISSENQGIEQSDKEYKYFISFFKYDKYPFLYKFFESYDYNKLEKRFQSLVQVDVHKCFHNIYTHSISWAIKNKYIAKRDRWKGGFDQEFDRIMQRSNYSETNGILIGPEISRIFAEIIFQDIDQNISSTLQSQGCKLGIDYDFRRYVDDYFVYFNDPNTKGKVIDVINSELFDYKLHLNEAKTTVSDRPFITEISLCKIDLSKSIEEIFKNRFIENEGTKKLTLVSNPGKKSNSLISNVKAVVQSHGVHYSSICNYLMSIFSRKIFEFISEIKKDTLDDESKKRAINWILIDIDILYFIRAMDPRIVTTDKLTRIILLVTDLKDNLNTSAFDLISKKIFDSSVEAIRIFNSSTKTIYSVESMNLLLLLSAIKRQYKLDSAFISESFGLGNSTMSNPCDNPCDSLYFLWVSLMLYIKDDNDYQAIKDELSERSTSFFKSNVHKFESTEYFLFWCDFLACPYVDCDKKIALVKAETNLSDIQKIKKYINDKYSDKCGLIIDWSVYDWLDKSIEKKVFKYAYE